MAEYVKPVRTPCFWQHDKKADVDYDGLAKEGEMLKLPETVDYCHFDPGHFCLDTSKCVGCERQPPAIKPPVDDDEKTSLEES